MLGNTTRYVNDGPTVVRETIRTVNRGGWVWQLVAMAALAGISQINYLLFHTLAESFSIMIAVMMCVVGWLTHSLTLNGFFTYLAVGFFWVAGIDMAHALTYKGMGIFDVPGANLAPQLWIAGRLLLAGLLVT
ncbi:MAG: MASE3 domain-containing protein, partial [Pseudomonadota bacterium]